MDESILVPAGTTTTVFRWAASFIPPSSVWWVLGLVDADVLLGLGRAQLQLAVDRQCVKQHGFRAILVQKGGPNLDPAILLAVASASYDGVDFAMKVGHDGENWLKKR
jgi:hypothetical protein